jgi:hypothetical protein
MLPAESYLYIRIYEYNDIVRILYRIKDDRAVRIIKVPNLQRMNIEKQE